MKPAGGSSKKMTGGGGKSTPPSSGIRVKRVVDTSRPGGLTFRSMGSGSFGASLVAGRLGMGTQPHYALREGQVKVNG